MFTGNKRFQFRITEIIQNYIDESTGNSLDRLSGEKAFGQPLVGFSSGADPLYEEYRKGYECIYQEKV